MATLDDFKKLDLRVGRILSAAPHPNADKLIVLSVDIGGAQKTVVAGIRATYAPKQLQGKSCILVANLEPVTLRGVESQGMLLAAKDARGLSIVTVEREVDPGSPVT